MKIRKLKVWLKILFAVVIPGLVLNLLFLNATTSNGHNFIFPTYEDNLKLRSYLQSKYKPGDVMSPEDFRANAALFGGKVEVFDILERIDTRTQDVIFKEGFKPTPNQTAGVGTVYDHVFNSTGNVVSTSSTRTALSSEPVDLLISKGMSAYLFGIVKPINTFADRYGRDTPPPPQEFVTENFRMKNVEGIEMPEKVVDKNGVKYDLPHREVVVREVLPNQIYEVAEVTRITVHSWERNLIGTKWVPKVTSGDPYNQFEFGEVFRHRELNFKPLNPNPNTSIPLEERSRNLTEPVASDSDKIQKGKNAIARAAFVDAMGPQPKNLTPPVSPPKNLSSVTVGNAPRMFAARAGTAAIVGSVLSETSKLSEKLKLEKDPMKRNEMINQAATSLNEGVLGAGLITVGMAGGAYLGIALFSGTAVATLAAPAAATTMLFLLIPMAADMLTDPGVLKGMAKAVLDPQSTATTSWKVLQADFSNGQDFFSNMMGFAGYLKDQMLELKNPQNETLTQAVARAAIKNDPMLDQATLSEQKINQTASASEAAWRNFKAGKFGGNTSVATTNSTVTGGAPTVSNSGGGNNSGNSTGSVSGGLSNSGVNVNASTSLGQGNGTTSSIDFYNVAVPKVPSTITGSSPISINGNSGGSAGQLPNLNSIQFPSSNSGSNNYVIERFSISGGPEGGTNTKSTYTKYTDPNTGAFAEFTNFDDSCSGSLCSLSNGSMFDDDPFVQIINEHRGNTGGLNW